jgi:DNA-binding response OmpR family regulator
VESDRYGAELNDSFLRAEGYEVELAMTAEDAEEKFASRDPALSIVELMISGGIGRELCQRLTVSAAQEATGNAGALHLQLGSG